MVRYPIIGDFYKKHITMLHTILTSISLIFYIIHHVLINERNLDFYYLIQGSIIFISGLICIRRHKSSCILMSYERIVFYITWFIIPFTPLSPIVFVEGIVMAYIYYSLLDLVFIPIDALPGFISIPVILILMFLNYIIMFIMIYLEFVYMRGIRNR